MNRAQFHKSVVPLIELRDEQVRREVRDSNVEAVIGLSLLTAAFLVGCALGCIAAAIVMG